jgi:tetratricopeptide (TPR) repeat protein
MTVSRLIPLNVKSSGSRNDSHPERAACSVRFASRTLLLGFAALAMAGLSLAGCSGPRPLHIVEKSAQSNYDRGFYDAAFADYAEYTDRRPEGVEMRYGKAQTLLQLGQPLEAAREMAIVYDVQPTNDKYVEGYCEAFFQANQRDQLVTFLQRQVGERGRAADYIRQGRFLTRLGNIDEAKTALRIAAQMDRGTTVEPQLSLANLYRTVNDRDNELRRLSMALFIEPGNQRIQERVRELGEFPGPAFMQVPEERIEAEQRAVPAPLP